METKYRLGWANSKQFIKTVAFLEGSMQFISDINIARCSGFEKQLGDRIELNIFCDSSSEAYGAVAYVNYFSE